MLLHAFEVPSATLVMSLIGKLFLPYFILTTGLASALQIHEKWKYKSSIKQTFDLELGPTMCANLSITTLLKSDISQ